MSMVSIIIPVYNTKITDLESCVNSIKAQTYHDFEVLFIDNGSEKNCADKLDEIAKADSRFTVFHKENRGVSVARNLGTEKSRGDYIMYVDADDLLTPYALEDGVSLIEKTDSDVVIGKVVKTSNRSYDLSGYKESGYEILETSDDRDDFRIHILNKSCPRFMTEGEISHNGEGCWSHLIKRKTALDNKFPEGVEVGEDTIWALDMLSEEQDIKLCLSKKVWYFYIQNDYSVLNCYNPRIKEQLTKPVGILNSVYLQEKDSLYKAYMDWIMIKLRHISSRFYLAEDNKDSFSSKRRSMKEMINNSPWKEVVKGRKCLSVSTRIKLFLYRRNLMLVFYRLTGR